MLENRPITQISLIGLGAFALVFFSAMSGTAFMISGGFGGGGAHTSSVVSGAYAGSPMESHPYDNGAFQTAQATSFATQPRIVHEAAFDRAAVDVEPVAREDDTPAETLAGDSAASDKDNTAADETLFPTTSNN